MAFIALDDSFQVVAYLAPLTVQWSRKYRECGDFVLEVLSENFRENFRYLVNTDRTELGLIQKVQLQKDGQSEKITLSGFFAEKLLDNCVIYPAYARKGDVVEIAEDLFNTYAAELREVFPNLTLNPSPIRSSVISYVMNYSDPEADTELGKALYSLLRPYALSYRIRYDFPTNKLFFEVFMGKTRTSDQRENSWCIFSEQLGNVASLDYTTDTSNSKNYFIGVLGDLVGVYDRSNGEEKRKILFTYDSSNDEEETEESLVQKLKQESSNYTNITNLSVQCDTSYYRYRTDYDLGDMCEISLKHLTNAKKQRIIEIRETVENAEEKIEIVLGAALITATQKARLQ